MFAMIQNHRTMWDYFHMLRSCAKAEGLRDSAERPVDGPDLRAMRGDARGNELSIDEADAFGKQAASFQHVSHVRRAYGWECGESVELEECLLPVWEIPAR
jgi:hypothetical protein